jgi:hypothetical protein
MSGGWYCSKCGALYSSPGAGLITCQTCGGLGLRGFARRPRRVECADCRWQGWDDGGVNDDLGRHRRREHSSPPPEAGPQPVEGSRHAPGCVLATKAASGHTRCACSCHHPIDVGRLRRALIAAHDGPAPMPDPFRVARAYEADR